MTPSQPLINSPNKKQQKRFLCVTSKTRRWLCFVSYKHHAYKGGCRDRTTSVIQKEKQVRWDCEAQQSSKKVIGGIVLMLGHVEGNEEEEN